jgi:hypothetical protein
MPAENRAIPIKSICERMSLKWLFSFLESFGNKNHPRMKLMIRKGKLTQKMAGQSPQTIKNPHTVGPSDVIAEAKMANTANADA